MPYDAYNVDVKALSGVFSSKARSCHCALNEDLRCRDPAFLEGCEMNALAITWIIIVAIAMLGFSIWMFPTNLIVAMSGLLEVAVLVAMTVILGRGVR